MLNIALGVLLSLPFSFDKTTHDFGDVELGLSYEADFILKNNSNQLLYISTIESQCGCAQVSFDKTAVSPNQKTTIKVLFEASSIGAFTKKIWVNTTLGNKELFIRGKVVKK